MRVLAAVLLAGLAVGYGRAAEKCVTQSQMPAADKDALVAAAAALAARIQANDAAGVKALTIAEYQKDFNGMSGVIAGTAPRLQGTAPEVTDVYLLDASALQAVNGTNPDAAFFCTLNQSPMETEFSIPQLPPGRYGFAIVTMKGATPWRLSLLLRQESGAWRLAGLYPKAMTAGGHDGLWYWKQARTLGGQSWSQWLYLAEAQQLLLPANFISSTHSEKLREELNNATPPPVSGGLSTDTPLVVKAKDGAEFRFTGLTVVDAAAQVDVAAHIKVDAAMADPAAARKRNLDAAAALVDAHPELRKAFHGVFVFADAPGAPAYTTELAMAEIP